MTTDRRRFIALTRAGRLLILNLLTLNLQTFMLAMITASPTRPAIAQEPKLTVPATPMRAPVPLELDVPFVVTPDNVVLKMLDMAQVSSSDQVLDLGSGDGRIVITAALRYGANASGVEVDPSLVERARSNAQKAGVAQRSRFEVRDLFATDLSQASVITMYLLPDVNLQLRPMLLKLRPGTRLVSHDWDMGDWAADQQALVDAPDKTIGLLKKAKLMLWLVPANVQGTHRAVGVQLTINQRYQQVTAATLRLGDREMHAESGRVAGPSVLIQGVDSIGKAFMLSANVAQQPASNAAINWRLRVAGEPERRLSTRHLE